MKRLLLWLTAILIPALVIGWSRHSPTTELRVAGAADLQRAFKELAPLYEKQFDVKVNLVFGSTGLLAKQAEQGAPFDLLFAADETYIANLEKQGKVVPGTRTLYGIGRLALWSRDARFSVKRIGDLASPHIRRIAIANPEHAPYGRAAKQAMQKAKVWDTVEQRVVYGENVQQAMQYAQTGNADVGIIAQSLAIGAGGSYTLVPDKLHDPIRQAVGVLKQSSNPAAARGFITFVLGKEGQSIMRKYGFAIPHNKP
jgi:molybdate transport system substrate-binding protein